MGNRETSHSPNPDDFCAAQDELSRANYDLLNLLNSPGIATVFLDRNLRVRRFTPQTIRIIKLIVSDVGRPISDLASVLDYPEWAENMREVLRTLVSVEEPAVQSPPHTCEAQVQGSAGASCANVSIPNLHRRVRTTLQQ